MLNSTEINPNVTDVTEQVIQKAHSLDMEIMCYAQDFPLWMRIVNGDSQTVPRRNMTEGSTYRMFLDVYEESWETLAREFQNITMWEIGNEFNMDAFLHPQGFNETIPDSPRFSVQEKANITTDLLYYGSLGVHEGNPKAKTVLGGLAPHPSIADFLDRIYKNIKSGRWPSIDPDDYFQIACWHPYLSDKKPTESNWVSPNKAIHDVMESHGDGDKRVVFSEMGYSDNVLPRDTIAKYLLEVFRLARNNFCWLDTIYWFRLVEIPNPSKHSPQGFGIINLDWTWKPAAYTYESLTHPFPWWILSMVSGGCLLVTIAVLIVHRLRFRSKVMTDAPKTN